MTPPSRRRFLQSAGAAALVPVAPIAGAAAAETPPHAGHAAHPTASAAAAEGPYLFLNAPEAAFIEAAVARLIPVDALGPGAVEAGVPRYIDLQLHGAWGAGERLFRGGPWHPGEPSQGYQLPFTPAELFRTAMRALRSEAERGGKPAFERLSGPQQDAFLTELQSSARDLGGVPAKVFFESLWGMTVEGYFSDPAYGGNRDMAAWQMIGFPGAYGAYYEHVDQHGIAFVAAPRSLAQDGRGRIHIHPDIPAGPSRGNAPPGQRRT